MISENVVANKKWSTKVVDSGTVQAYVQGFEMNPNWPENPAILVSERENGDIALQCFPADVLAKAVEAVASWDKAETLYLVEPPPGYIPVLFVGQDTYVELAYLVRRNLQMAPKEIRGQA